MPLGAPAVLTPKALDLRAVQGTVNAIRERLQFIEQAITLAAARTNSSTTTGDITALQAQLAQLAARLSSVESATGGDSEVELTAGAAIDAGDPVVMVGLNSCAPVDVTDPTAIYAVVGLAKSAAATGQSVTVTRWGNFSVTDGSLDVGRAVYANEGGGLTQFPSYTDVAIPVGVATGTATMWVSPAWPSLRVLGFESGYEDFLPPTVGLVRDAILLTEDFNAAADGIAVKTGENDITPRTLTGTAARVSVANGSGVGGNPTIDIDAGYVGQTSITTLGTIGTGVWQGTPVAIANGGTGQTTKTAAFDALAPTTTKGDLVVYDGTDVVRQAVGADGTVLTADSGSPSGLAWTLAGVVPVGDDPTANVGLTPVNGVATTFMRSDAAPALDVAIDPTWTGTHAFANTIVGSVNGNASTATALQNARNINGVSFNGTADITVTAAAGTLTGGTLAAGVTASSLTSVGTVTSGTWEGTPIAAGHGGTGLTSYAVGDLLYASTTSALSKLADVATGNALISGGVGAAPSWGKIGLTTHVSGILPEANGGTGSATRPYVLLAGDTMSGDLEIAKATAPVFSLNATANSVQAILQFKTSGATRWVFRKTNTTESGSNSGSDFGIRRYNDAGVFIEDALLITRSTGNVSIPQSLSVTNGITGSLTGNASTATALQTARAINGTSFNGTADITVTAAAGTLTGATLNATVTASSLTSVGTLGSLTVTGATTSGTFIPSSSSAPTNGMYLYAANALGWSVNSVASMFLSAAGNLGVGIAPVSGVKLQVKAAADQNLGVLSQSSAVTLAGLTDAGSATTTRYAGKPLILAANGGAIDAMTFDNSGNALYLLTTAAPTLAVNRHMVMNLTSDTNLRFSVRGSDGTTRTANLTLA